VRSEGKRLHRMPAVREFFYGIFVVSSLVAAADRWSRGAAIPRAAHAVNGEIYLISGYVIAAPAVQRPVPCASAVVSGCNALQSVRQRSSRVRSQATSHYFQVNECLAVQRFCSKRFAVPA
jgi:hypothetical protein